MTYDEALTLVCVACSIVSVTGAIVTWTIVQRTMAAFK